MLFFFTAKIRELSGNDKIVSKNFDQSDMRSVRQLADELNREEEKIDILINNAGIQAWEQVVSTTDDGLEYQMAVNYFGAFLLTNLIIGKFAFHSPRPKGAGSLQE